MKTRRTKKTIGAAVLAATAAPVIACSSGAAPSSLGPFTISACRMGYSTDANYGVLTGKLYASESEAPGGYAPRASEFTITLTATAVVSSFTVAYYGKNGVELGTDPRAMMTEGGPGANELTAGQKATFESLSVPDGAVSCQVIGSDSGNA